MLFILNKNNLNNYKTNFNFSIFHANIRFNEIKLRQYSDVMKIVREVIESGYGIFKRKSIRYTSSYRSQRQNSQDLSINNTNKTIKKLRPSIIKYKEKFATYCCLFSADSTFVEIYFFNV